MPCYIIQEGHPEAISREEEERLIAEADATGYTWYIDLGDDAETGERVNLLIIEQDIPDYDPDRGRDMVELDAETLAMAGWGTDEDYGRFSDDDEYYHDQYYHDHLERDNDEPYEGE